MAVPVACGARPVESCEEDVLSATDEGEAGRPDLRANPARPRLLNRARRRAFLVLGGAVVVCSAAGTAVALAFGVPRLDESDVGGFVAGVLVTQAVVVLALGGLAVLVARRSTRVVESLFKQEDRLIRAVAHEVRSPLNRAMVVLDEGGDESVETDAVLAEAVEHLEDADVLIGDLVEVARVMAGGAAMPRSPVRLDEVVADAVRATPIGSSSVTVESEPVVVDGAERLLRRAVSNLVRNAARHGYALGEGVVTVRVDHRGVTVLDEGPGVTPEKLVELHFETTLSLAQEGPGLGLYLAGWIAEMHGGRLALANRPGGGFSAGLDLPVTPVDAVHPTSADIGDDDIIDRRR